MRGRAYFAFELVAWPAAVWCTFELMLRAVTGARQGMAETGLIGTCAALTIIAARWRARVLALAVADTRDC